MLKLSNLPNGLSWDIRDNTLGVTGNHGTLIYIESSAISEEECNIWIPVMELSEDMAMKGIAWNEDYGIPTIASDTMDGHLMLVSQRLDKLRTKPLKDISKYSALIGSLVTWKVTNYSGPTIAYGIKRN